MIQGDDMCFNFRVAKILTCNSITCNCDLAKCVVIILILIDQTKLEGVSLLVFATPFDPSKKHGSGDS